MSDDRRVTAKSMRSAYNDELLSLLAATSPAAKQIIDSHLAQRRPGRRAKSELQYRRLDAWWKAFLRSSMAAGLTEKQALAKFWRVRRLQIEKMLEIKRTTSKSRWNAIARGATEAEKVRSRRAGWQIVPTGLDQAVHGRMHRIVRDPNEAILIRGVFRSLLGK